MVVEVARGDSCLYPAAGIWDGRESWNDLGWEKKKKRDLKAHPVPMGRNTSHLSQAGPSLVQPGLGHFQGLNNHRFSGKSLLHLEYRNNRATPPVTGSEIKNFTRSLFLTRVKLLLNYA